MTDTVVIKGNKHGLTIILNKDDAFDKIKAELGEKLLASRKFFGKSALTIGIKGRVLTNIEENELIEIIQTNSDLTVTCFVEDNSDSDIKSPRKPQPLNVEVIKVGEGEPISANQNNDSNIVTTADIVKMTLPSNSKKVTNFKENYAVFRQGTLRSGQELHVDDSVVFIGNVHAGAKITAKGHVVIIGNLLGSVHAGYGGYYKAFVLALKMKPTQIRIGKFIGRSPDKQEDINTPRVAYVVDEQISIEDIDYSIFEELNLNKS